VTTVSSVNGLVPSWHGWLGIVAITGALPERLTVPAMVAEPAGREAGAVVEWAAGLAWGLSQPFDATTQGKPNGSLIDYASSSTSWIENQRKTANDNSQYQNTLLDRSTTALSNVNGVNMDDEMSLMLQVERTYSASSKIISTVDQMLQALLAAVGT